MKIFIISVYLRVNLKILLYLSLADLFILNSSNRNLIYNDNLQKR